MDGVYRAIEDFKRKGVKTKDVLDALKNPIKICEVKIDSKGLKSQRFIGRLGEVVIKPDNGNIVSVNPTDSAKSARCLKT